MPTGAAATCRRRPRIEAGEDAWYWGVPLPDGTYNTLVFVDAKRFRAAGEGTLTSRFLDLLDRSRLMEGWGAAEMIAAPSAIDATAYVDDECASPNSLKIGDAALALDPLSSSGVQKAIQGALSAAIVANTLLRRPEAHAAALQFYRASLAEASARHRAWASGHYATVSVREPGSFWSARCAWPATPVPSGPVVDATLQLASNTGVQLSPDAELLEVPRLGPDFVGLGPALHHPTLEAPVAYLGGWELAPLLRQVRAGMTPLQVVHSWSPRVPIKSGLAIAGWMLGRGILVPRAGESRRVAQP